MLLNTFTHQIVASLRAGFKGRNCEINIDDCEKNMCQNGATCVDGVNTYTCACPPTFTGPYCTEDVDECAVRPTICEVSPCAPLRHKAARGNADKLKEQNVGAPQPTQSSAEHLL